jgi:glutathione-independent formaldehyde dehydrogenase
MNTEVIPLDHAIDAYRAFDEGSPKKFIIDPHGSLKHIRKGKETERTSKRELAHA